MSKVNIIFTLNIWKNDVSLKASHQYRANEVKIVKDEDLLVNNHFASARPTYEVSDSAGLIDSFKQK